MTMIISKLFFIAVSLQVSHCWLASIPLQQSPVAFLQPATSSASSRIRKTRMPPLSVGYEPSPGNSPNMETDNFASNNDSNDDRLSDEELMATVGEWDDTKPRFNTIHLTGRTGNDPEPRYFDDGKVVVNLSLANKRKYHSMERNHLNIRTGDEETDWYGLEIWGQTAEFVSKFVDKGMRVGVIGSLQIDEWTDKVTNEPRNRVKVIVRDFDILETRAESEARRANTGSSRGPAFYTNDDDDDGGPASGGNGGFFDN